jgi:hypothetical protein
MPSRRSAARRRLHRDRVIAKRIKLARDIAHLDLAEIVPGRLDDHQYYIGCSRPRCRLCHPEKNLPSADCQRADEAWRHLEQPRASDDRVATIRVRITGRMVAAPALSACWTVSASRPTQTFAHAAMPAYGERATRQMAPYAASDYRRGRWRAQLEVGRWYAYREKRGPRYPILTVRLLDKVGRKGKIKIRFEDGPHPGLEEYISTRQLVVRGDSGTQS